MAIQGKPQTPGSTSMSGAFANATQAAQPAPSQSNFQATAQPQSNGFSFKNFGSVLRAPIPRTQTGEALSKILKALEKVVAESASKEVDVALIPIPYEQTPDLNISVIVMAIKVRAAPALGVAYHTLIVEGSVDPIGPKFEMVNGRNVELMKVAGDTFDKTMLTNVTEFLRRNFSNIAPSDLHCAESCVIPRDFNILDEVAVKALAANAAYACYTELERKSRDFQDINLANVINDSSLSARITFGNPQKADVVGLPIRSDIVIDLNASGNTQNAQQSTERTNRVSSLSGFLDLIWAPQGPVPTAGMMLPQQQQGWGQQQQQISYQRYAARFIIKEVAGEVLTPSAVLLALSTALVLEESNVNGVPVWVQGFQTRHQVGGGIDKHDIGAVAIEVNREQNPSGYGTRLNTNDEKFKTAELFQLIAATFAQGLIFSIDVPEAGGQTWYTSIFSYAAGGDHSSNNALIHAANVLTNGAFDKHFQGGFVCDDEDNRIHQGYYIGADGTKCDLCELDYLAVMNLLGDKDPAIITKWSNTFDPKSAPLAVRLADRKDIIVGLAGNVVFTGFARRITFTKSFMVALGKACHEAGLNIKAISPYADNNGYVRGSSQFVNDALVSGDTSGVFNRGFSQQTNFGGNRTFVTNRF